MATPLGLGKEDLEVSRSVLRDFGNCSSPTVLLVLERLVERLSLRNGDHVVCVTFGPGLTISAAVTHREGVVAAAVNASWRAVTLIPLR